MPCCSVENRGRLILSLSDARAHQMFRHHRETLILGAIRADRGIELATSPMLSGCHVTIVSILLSSRFSRLLVARGVGREVLSRIGYAFGSRMSNLKHFSAHITASFHSFVYNLC